MRLVFRPSTSTTSRHSAWLVFTLAAMLSSCTSTGSRTAQIAAEAEASRIQTAFPVAQIQSVKSAIQAKTFVQQERVQMLHTFSAREQECYDSFFTTRCLSAAEEKKRVSLNAVRNIEVEADAFLRREKVHKRDEALAEKQDKEKRSEEALEDKSESAAEPAETIRTLTSSNLDEEAIPRARPLAPGKAEHGSPTGLDPRVVRHQQLRKQQKEKKAAEAASREESARKFEEKKRQAEERQREIARTKAEKALQNDAMKDDATIHKKSEGKRQEGGASLGQK